MTTHRSSDRGSDPLDDLAEQLLGCGALLSQIVSHMVRFQAAGKSAPDTAPIPEIARGLIRDVIGGLAKGHPPAELRAAVGIVAEATEAIGSEILLVSPDLN